MFQSHSRTLNLESCLHCRVDYQLFVIHLFHYYVWNETWKLCSATIGIIKNWLLNHDGVKYFRNVRHTFGTFILATISITSLRRFTKDSVMTGGKVVLSQNTQNKETALKQHRPYHMIISEQHHCLEHTSCANQDRMRKWNNILRQGWQQSMIWEFVPCIFLALFSSSLGKYAPGWAET